MKETFTVIFYLKKSKTNTQGKAPIYLRVTVKGKRSEISLKHFIEPTKWNNDRQKLNGTCSQTKCINTNIDLVRARIYDAHNYLIQNGKLVSAKAITNKHQGKDELGKTVLEVFEHHNERMKSYIGKKYSKSTYIKYNTSYNHLKCFMEHEYKVNDMLLMELNHAYIASFECFLRTIKCIGTNSTNKYLSHLKKVINLAIQNEWLLKNPFSNFKTKNEKVDVTFLSEDELTILAKLELEKPSSNRVRDIFLFCCFTGLSYIDIKNLTKDEIDIGIDGNIWIRKKRQKTGGLSRIRIVPIAEELLSKYKNDDNIVFPVTSNQNMNRILKQITIKAELPKQLSMHMARHTFATYALTKNVSIETISQMLGHKSIKSTEMYAKVIDSKISDEMDLFGKSIPTKISLSKVC